MTTLTLDTDKTELIALVRAAQRGDRQALATCSSASSGT